MPDAPCSLCHLIGPKVRTALQLPPRNTHQSSCISALANFTEADRRLGAWGTGARSSALHGAQNARFARREEATLSGHSLLGLVLNCGRH